MPVWFIVRAILILTVFLQVVPLPAVTADAAEWADALQRASQGEYAEAVRIADQLLPKDAKDGNANGQAAAPGLRAEMLYRRGRWNFRLGNIDASLADFDRLIQLEPAIDNRLWERGITCFYAGRMQDGARQFEKYQTYYSNDVENAVWRYLCQVPTSGRQEAAKQLLPIANDRRVPMMEIYQLFRDQAKPADVLARIEPLPESGPAGRQSRFDAYLYLGLYFDAQAKLNEAKKYIDQAVAQFDEGHYMWAVAVQHQRYLEAKMKQPGDVANSDKDSKTESVDSPNR